MQPPEVINQDKQSLEPSGSLINNILVNQNVLFAKAGTKNMRMGRSRSKKRQLSLRKDLSKNMRTLEAFRKESGQLDDKPVLMQD